ncbi:MAG: HmuY family protein [Spirochaetales bacterium]|nr:HmuY family protein [Spirochaetales bacterium]
MKYLTILITLVLITLPITAQDFPQTIIIDDFDFSFEGFSLSRGELVIVNMEEEFLLPVEIDFIFDLPNGLGMNNEELAPGFSGTAGILDLGPAPLMEDTDFPEDNFILYLMPEDIIPGHTYIIRTTDTDHYGKIHIVDINAEIESLEFTWVYLDM